MWRSGAPNPFNQLSYRRGAGRLFHLESSLSQGYSGSLHCILGHDVFDNDPERSSRRLNSQEPIYYGGEKYDLIEGGENEPGPPVCLYDVTWRLIRANLRRPGEKPEGVRMKGRGLAFLHGRSARGSAECLVAVEVARVAPQTYELQALSVRRSDVPVTAMETDLYYPRKTRVDLVARMPEEHDRMRIRLGEAARLTILAGDHDEHDSSRFSISYVVNEQRATIVGTINGEGIVSFRPPEEAPRSASNTPSWELIRPR
jgi:hypothetical protein